MTYGNPRTGVIHWMGRNPAWAMTACSFLHRGQPAWDQTNLDRAGVPADVTCRKCRETREFLNSLDTRPRSR